MRVSTLRRDSCKKIVAEEYFPPVQFLHFRAAAEPSRLMPFPVRTAIIRGPCKAKKRPALNQRRPLRCVKQSAYRPLCSPFGGGSCLGGALSRCCRGAFCFGAVSRGAGRGALSLACGAGRDSCAGGADSREGRDELDGRLSLRGALSVRGLDACELFDARELGGGLNGFAAWLSLGRAELARLFPSGRFEELLLLGGTKGRSAAFAPPEFEPREDVARFSAGRLPAPGVARASFGEIDGA